MKKIIAMLLAVAMVAALGINAFAQTTTVLHTQVSTFAEYYNAIAASKVAAAGSLKEYAQQLSWAKEFYGNKVKDYKTMLGYVADATKAAQYGAVAEYYLFAADAVEKAALEAINQFQAQVAWDLNHLKY